MPAASPNPNHHSPKYWARGFNATVMDREPAYLQLADSHVLIHVPHAGTLVPQVKPLPPIDLLNRETTLLCDRHTDQLANLIDLELTRRGLNVANRVTNIFSRVFMDPERFDSEDEEMNQVGMGVLYTKTHDGQDLYNPPLPAEEAHRRKAKYFLEYSSKFTQMVDGILTDKDRCLIVDLHSYTTDPLPHERHANESRPPVCIGFDNFHAADVGALASELTKEGFDSAFNQPFHGSYVPLSHYRKDTRVKSVMVEIRRDQYLDQRHNLLAAPASRLAAAVATWIAKS